jgi:2-C-methyl-D-erythritol 4-phosphate cytidylyltransferase
MPKYQSVIVVAGGQGTRMNSDTPKQFMLLGGRPLLLHTLQKFIDYDKHIELILVLSTDLKEQWKHLCNTFKFTFPYKLVSGGKTRFHSVKNGLEYISEGRLVGIHDAARPFVSTEVIARTFSKAQEVGNAVPSIAVGDSVRIIQDSSNRPIDRNKLQIIQTPQVFRSELIKEAYENANSTDFTDDAGVLENAGHAIHLVQGTAENFKITTPFDLEMAQVYLERNNRAE